jgi:hypothetical protein
MTIKSAYDKLTSDRSPYLLRARECSKFTLPWLVPAQGATGATRLRVTYSSFGARCVNSLSNKLLLALFPPRQAFFKLSVSKEMMDQLGGPKMKADIDKALGSIEELVLSEINTTPTRTPAGEAVKHLLVAGNALVYIQPEGGLKVFPLSSFVVRRDKAGNPLTIIVEEKVALIALPKEVRDEVEAKLKAKKRSDENLEDGLCIYTAITRDGDSVFGEDSEVEESSAQDKSEGNWVVRQEVEGIEIEVSAGSYPVDACPWLPLRWIPDSTGPYGRGLVEDYLGHLVSLESLSASLVKATAVAAKIVFLRNPNGTTKASKLTQAETGAVIDGKAEDIMVLQVGKQVDLATARQMTQDLKEELAFAFALNQAVQRNAERVTAEEIRYMAQELDSTLGGNYSTLSMDFQLPYLRRLMVQMEKQKKLPVLPKGSIRPVIVTGLDALGRGADLDNLRALVKDVVDLGGPEALKTYLNFDDLLKRLTTSRGITTDGLIKTAEEVAAAQQQDQMMQMQQQLGPNAVNAAGGIAKQAMAGQQAQAAAQPPTQ